jgi:hypothetical protein
MNSNFIRALPPTDDLKRAWQNKVATGVNGNNAIAGSGISVDNGPYGATISISDDPTSAYLPFQYMGDFDGNAEYFPNQIVRVRPDGVYLDITGNPLDIGSTADSGYETFPISPGLYICVNYVPPGFADETWVQDLAQYYPSGIIPWTVSTSVRWNSYNVYWPMYPEIPSQYTASVSVTAGSGQVGIVANQNFWNALPVGMRAMNMCLPNGTLATAYVMAYISGSVFQPEYLPYQP